jgi:hypothetical protein
MWRTARTRKKKYKKEINKIDLRIDNNRKQ